jgi:hypothetical protein
MVESMARNVLKAGMKTWILTTERLLAGLAQLREELDDVLVEARHEYEHRAEGAASARTEPAPDAKAKVSKPKTSRARSARTGTPKRTRTTEVAV